MKTTDDVLREFDQQSADEQQRLKETQKRSREFLQEMCDLGLIDDVVPTSYAAPIVVTCLGCGREVPGEGIICPDCPPGTLIRFS